MVIVGYIHDNYPDVSFTAKDNVWLLKLDLDGCIANEECRDYSFITSETNIYPADKYLLFPNPTYNVINLVFGTYQNYHISVIDNLSQVIDRKSGFDQQCEFRLSTLPSGLYFVTGFIEDKRISYQFFKF